MKEKEIDLIIVNQFGLHTRAASKLVNLVLKFTSEVYIEVVKTGVKANCKSIMSLMMLGASYGTLIIVSAEGDDAEEVIDSVQKLVLDRFGEET